LSSKAKFRKKSGGKIRLEQWGKPHVENLVKLSLSQGQDMIEAKLKAKAKEKEKEYREIECEKESHRTRRKNWETVQGKRCGRYFKLKKLNFTK
jgi:glutaredoxin